jgi:hypothetical protein
MCNLAKRELGLGVVTACLLMKLWGKAGQKQEQEIDANQRTAIRPRVLLNRYIVARGRPSIFAKVFSPRKD